ncbi:MAG: hypothetical protein AAF384_03820 [Pseudomonadota bacterium]
MKIKNLLEEWGITSLKLNAGFVEADFEPRDDDQDGAWKLYVELITRTATQALPADAGDEKTALESIHNVFGITRDIIKEHGRRGEAFTRIAIAVLNQWLRPFCTKWHRADFASAENCTLFRTELSDLQSDLRKYTGVLANLAGTEDVTDLGDPA